MGNDRRTWFWPGACLAIATVAAYGNSFTGPFIFDDRNSILGNATIRHLWPLTGPLFPPSGHGATPEGRPVFNLSLALNYAFGGSNPVGYHLVNLAVHVLAALLLFGIVRRTASIAAPQARADAGLFFGFWVALLWAVHPLQTESVTYISQRAESLMGMFYLLALYGFIRGATGPRPGFWLAASAAACACGMGTKEVMVSAPLMVLLYDRTFVAGSFREAWRQRRLYYVGLGATWLFLGWLVVGEGDRGHSIGAASGVPWWEYALCQARALAHYLRLAVWPSPLVIDYGSDNVTWREALPYVLIDAGLIGATLAGFLHRSIWGFIGAWFFVILAPSSSVIGGSRQMLAEHRVYVSLAAVAVLLVAGIHRLAGRWASWILAPIAIALIVTTLRRNSDYRSEFAILSDTVAKRPDNGFARLYLGHALYKAGRITEGIEQLTEAVRLRPNDFSAQGDLANALNRAGRLGEAISHYRIASQLAPAEAEPHYYLGLALARAGRIQEAKGEFTTALRMKPDFVSAREKLDVVLREMGQRPQADRSTR